MSENETVILDFEKTIVEIEEKINHLKTIFRQSRHHFPHAVFMSEQCRILLRQR